MYVPFLKFFPQIIQIIHKFLIIFLFQIGNSDSCSRGCRLFMIAALISDKQDADQNASRNSCKDSKLDLK